MEELFESTAFTVNFILQLILLIVFLRLAWNVGKIRKHIVRSDYEYLFKHADMLEFIGKKQEAIETYKEYIYKIRRSDLDPGDKTQKVNAATNCIEALGGEVSFTKSKK